MTKSQSLIVTLLVLTILIAAQAARECRASDTGSGLKTSHKRYAVYPYGELSILCEPYVVRKNDWLYKIFRQKGMISEEDFPLFLTIFKSLNPEVSNIDTIQTGQHIMIPLKKVNAEDYKLDDEGLVNVPVLQFLSPTDRLDTFTTAFTVRLGDTVSELLDPAYLNPDGSVSEKGERVFRLLNPGVKNIDVIYQGQTLYLPTPELADQPWFADILPPALPPPPASGGMSDDEPISLGNQEETEYSQVDNLTEEARDSPLKRFASAIGGFLYPEGHYYLPSRDGRQLVLDLSRTPMIRQSDGRRLIVIQSENDLPMSIEMIESTWPDVDVRLAADVVPDAAAGTALASTHQPAGKDQEAGPIDILPADHTAAVHRLLDLAGFDYESEAKVPINLGTLQIEAPLERVERQGGKDLLLNFGSVYGKALDELTVSGLDLMTILPGEPLMAVAQALFTRLSLSVASNPAFLDTVKGKAVTIPGLYVSGIDTPFFVTDQILELESIDFLQRKNIQILYTVAPSEEDKT